MHGITSLYFTVPCNWLALETTLGLHNKAVNDRTEYYSSVEVGRDI